MRRYIAVLEDNDDRIAAMERCLADKFPFFERKFFRTASDTIDWLGENMGVVICLCLDHDLEPPADRPTCEPGTGRDVAEFLAGVEPCFPVVLQTTNAFAGIAMEAMLGEQGWRVERVMPYEDLVWVAEAWLPTVRQVIVDAAEIRRELLESPARREV
ncbi:MAG TPA: cyclic-phosphate processing receiver domain-containing protein [Pirellulaceae bacterium]|nr:cyclic-phosphate processing receiver domain-containing protein [Pirellulaceae bacterium]